VTSKSGRGICDVNIRCGWLKPILGISIAKATQPTGQKIDFSGWVSGGRVKNEPISESIVQSWRGDSRRKLLTEGSRVEVTRPFFEANMYMQF
jgi:hypothetical protein